MPEPLQIKLRTDSGTVRHLDATPLHWACNVRRIEDRVGQTQILQLLVDHGAYVNAKDRRDVTPLHRAVRARSPAAVQFLLEHGADVNAQDRGRGSTPLRQAVTNTGAGGTAGRGEEAIAITELLLAYGADPFMRNKAGKMVIESVRNPAILELLQAGAAVDLGDKR